MQRHVFNGLKSDVYNKSCLQMAFVTVSSGNLSLAAYCKVLLERNCCSSRRDVKVSSTELIELCGNLSLHERNTINQIVY